MGRRRRKDWSYDCLVQYHFLTKLYMNLLVNKKPIIKLDIWPTNKLIEFVSIENQNLKNASHHATIFCKKLFGDKMAQMIDALRVSLLVLNVDRTRYFLPGNSSCMHLEPQATPMIPGISHRHKEILHWF